MALAHTVLLNGDTELGRCICGHTRQPEERYAISTEQGTPATVPQQHLRKSDFRPDLLTVEESV